jgi:hypothetical protein
MDDLILPLGVALGVTGFTCACLAVVRDWYLRKMLERE